MSRSECLNSHIETGRLMGGVLFEAVGRIREQKQKNSKNYFTL